METNRRNEGGTTGDFAWAPKGPDPAIYDVAALISVGTVQVHAARHGGFVADE